MKLYFKNVLAKLGILHPALGIKISQEEKAKKILAAKGDIKILVETGTREGWMLERVGSNFEQIYSAELDEALQHKNLEKFKNNPRIKLLHGDSAVEIKKILAEVTEPALFWLDAHNSGTINETNAPIMGELRSIFSHPIKNHVILIDDARHFERETIKKMKDLARENNYKFELKDGIFRLHGK